MKSKFALFAGGRVLGSLLQAIIFLLFTRVSTISEVGAAGIVFGACLFLGTFADLGMMNFVSRARAVNRDDHEVAQALVVNRYTSIAAAAVFAFGAWALAPTGVSSLALALLAISVAVEKNVETALAVPIADDIGVMPATSIVLRRASALVAFLALQVTGLDGLTSYAVSALIGNLVGQIQIQIWLSKHVRASNDIRFSHLVSVAQKGAPFLLSNVAGQARTLDTVFLGLFSTSFQAGLYAAATRLTAPLMLVPGTLTTILMPHAAKSSSAAARTTARNIILAYLACLLPLGIVGIFAEPLIVLVLTDRFAGAALPFTVALLSVPFVALSPALGAILQGQGHERLVAINGVVSACVLLVALVAGSIGLGATGVALAVGVVYFLKSVSLWQSIRTHLH
ncbi:lipopolysaccharide biosynthesis protein [Naasia lichenicola]|uniref:Lipopolysaccharide biosynthesis protein n=1 Tax=Naasia lichenicola TaxID=2565933 RepID=A0A4S4FMV1_9MICO|nr:lipopolysaccharide biosynthesis protein [Naasia lichenicola]THG30775.1 lipopolysaccharide biosynthesis protein [Naasia lichenicola]THG32012.1 lipopolysaccharide biosynthesis protein [Naasia lichenicola]